MQALLAPEPALAEIAKTPVYERMAEWTIESKQKQYADPFNDVDVDVIFTRGTQSWRVPTFWRGGQRWTVRFAPSEPGIYGYTLSSTDPGNKDLNGRPGQVRIAPYQGESRVLRHGIIHVAPNGRNFAHADGTPFYWLGDTWWTSLSDRLSWSGYQRLVRDRKDKGFTVIQLVAGLVPGPEEELSPSDPGNHNEGGYVWEGNFARINPGYFDAADRRIQLLVDEGLVPAIVGAWNKILPQMGARKMKQHWRYIIARYGAYPVFWIVGGEVIDPPPRVASLFPRQWESFIAPGWTDIARYVRASDPNHHLLTAHQASPPWDTPLQDEAVEDFAMFQSAHWGWQSIAASVAQLTMHYSRTSEVKPLVQGEIGYETLGGTHLEDFQRVAFWLSMLNGAAGHTYGANGTWQSYEPDKPLHRIRHSFMSWEEGMALPGSYQVGLGAKLLQQYRWWKFEPHPEWVSPRGTTLFEPRAELDDVPLARDVLQANLQTFKRTIEDENLFPGGEWQQRHGNFRMPYAAGIPREVRVVYIPPQKGLLRAEAPTILGLEPGVHYSAFFWEPATGTRIDLGSITRPQPRVTLFERRGEQRWLMAPGETLSLSNVRERDVVAKAKLRRGASARIRLRYQDESNYVAVLYDADRQSLYIVENIDGEKQYLSEIQAPTTSEVFELDGEVRGNKAAASLRDDQSAFSTPIVDIRNVSHGAVSMNSEGNRGLEIHEFQVWRSPEIQSEPRAQRRFYDARGQLRGKLEGESADPKRPGWSDFGKDKHILLDAYRPEKLPTSGDWILVLAAGNGFVEPNQEAPASSD